LPSETTALIDAETGNVFINPGSSVLAPYEQRRKLMIPAVPDRDLRRQLSSVTADGREITLLANINLLSDTIDARSVMARGIGLYRTEFPFLIRNAFPVEEEQYVVYRKLMENMNGLPVTIRTLDIGGDKALSYYSGYVENNPFLGMRSIRFCLENRDVFKTQLRAILRAGHGTDLKIMFPMISSIDELDEAKTVLEECKRELAGEKVLFHPDPPVGIMIELPSAIEICDELAERSDFFSIGTNDLVQYMLAVDRTNQKVAKYYCSHQPSVLRAINKAVIAAKNAGIEISVCGDMANDGRYLEFLIGIGIKVISIDPVYFPNVCASLGSIDSAAAAEKAARMLACSSIREVEEVMGKKTG
jgi:phosphotransferase system enzyme I (PtsP)